MRRTDALREIAWTIGAHVFAGLVLTLTLLLLAGGGS
jgi:hypothetical protein